jgi:threonyl-tRNA synthetase
MVYRDEQSGELGGLSRVRAITQDDAHVFMREAQIHGVLEEIWDIVSSFYGAFDLELKVRFSRHDPDKMDSYIGNEATWKRAEADVLEVINAHAKGDYIDGLGEAAFYGPKIDFIGHDVFGREFQAATIQLDFGQPEGFDLVCINEAGERERIVMAHAAIMGSIERFMVLLIEHTGGRFPVWLAPEQVRVARVNDDPKVAECAEKLLADLRAAGLRAELDASNESVGKKIRAAELAKVPYTLVIGGKEADSGMVTPRVRADLAVHHDAAEMTIDNFIKSVANEAKTRATRASL